MQICLKRTKFCLLTVAAIKSSSFSNEAKELLVLEEKIPLFSAEVNVAVDF